MTDHEQQRLRHAIGEFVAALGARGRALTNAVRLSTKLFDHKGPDLHKISHWLESAAEATVDCPVLEQARRELVALCASIVSVALLQLESELREICSSRCWRIDGQWPDFFINFGIRVHIKERAKTATVGALRCRAEAIAVAKALEPQVQSLIPGKFSPRTFMEGLLGAYRAVASSSSTQAPIFEVYRSFVIQSQPTKFWRDARAESFTPISLDQFRARLSTTLKDSTIGISGLELRLLPPIDSKDGLFLYQPSEGRFGYVGRIEFVTSDGAKHAPVNNAAELATKERTQS
jgi:hypothetical protein